MRIKKFKYLLNLRVEIEEFESYRIFQLVDEENQKIASFTIDRDMQEDSEEFDLAYLQGLSLKEDLRGKGMSKMIFKPLIREVKKFGYNSILLTVSTDNKAAIRLYQSLGFSISRGINKSKSKDGIINMMMDF